MDQKKAKKPSSKPADRTPSSKPAVRTAEAAASSSSAAKEAGPGPTPVGAAHLPSKGLSITGAGPASSPKAAPTVGERSKKNDGDRLDKIEEMLQVLMTNQLSQQSQKVSKNQSQKVNTKPGMRDITKNVEYDEFDLAEELVYEDDDCPFYGDEQGLSGGGAQAQESVSGAEHSGATPPPLAAKFATPSGVGRPLPTDIADSLGYMITHKLDPHTIEETGENYAVPENCPALEIPKVNATVWDNLRPNTRAKDAKIQKVQRILSRGITAVGHSISEVTDTQQDALALLANAQYELTALRKEFMKPDINPRLGHLLKSTTHCTGQLFGEDLSKQIKDLQEEQKVAAGVGRPGGSKFGQTRQRPEYRPYPATANRNQERYRHAGWTTSQQGQRPFLSTGHAHAPRPAWKRDAPRTAPRTPAQKRPHPSGQDGPGKRLKNSR